MPHGDDVPERDIGEDGTLNTMVQSLIDNYPTFQRFLHRRLNNEALAKDLLQQSFIRALQHHHTLRNKESAVAWFYQILRHAMIDYYRSQAAEERRDEALAQGLIVAEEDKAPPPDELEAAACACLHRLLPTMRQNYADLVRRLDLEQQSPEAVAQELKITPNNLTVRLHRARQALRARLEESCGICSKHGCLNCTCQ
jgi:RNA polymerase sigma-70 factor (ECF subfamily)